MKIHAQEDPQNEETTPPDTEETAVETEEESTFNPEEEASLNPEVTEEPEGTTSPEESLPDFPTEASQPGISTLSQSGGSTLNPDDLMSRCIQLNNIRANFTACCQYPTLVIWRGQLNQCLSQCQQIFSDFGACCMPLCTFRAIQLIPPVGSTANNSTFNPSNGRNEHFLNISSTFNQTFRFNPLLHVVNRKLIDLGEHN